MEQSLSELLNIDHKVYVESIQETSVDKRKRVLQILSERINSGRIGFTEAQHGHFKEKEK